MPTSTPSSYAAAGRWLARWGPAVIMTLLGCAGCNGDGMPAPPAPPWAHSGVVHRAAADAVTLGAVVIDRVEFEARSVEVVQQDRVTSHAAWVELVNPGNEAVRLAGFGVSDQKAQPFKWVFPADAVLVAGGRLGVWLETPSEANTSVRVTAPDGTAAGVLLDSAQALRPSVHAGWCRRRSGAAGARFGPCAADALGQSSGRHEELAALVAPSGPLHSRE